ncbi:MAG: UDP-N-acetylglucosamine 2-epimerase (non-hydrolyzing) [Planctomycetes bacterium]|nr:UDP-N-acetylglucosamine 2-epimerase (non-hydrolyzing) [Planctomycetota bacterium]
MKKLCFIFGTRPETIKLAPIILLAKEQPDRFEVDVCVTGQHREMLDQMLSLFGIVPNFDLGLMRPNQTLADISARTIQAVSSYLEENRPDWVLVQGDTATVWAAAIAAFFLNIPVAHVEAGLRTNDKRQPFPEEVNRRIASQIADLHLAPTQWSQHNLLDEGIPPKQVVVTGNTVIDALYWMLDQNKNNPNQEVASIKDWVDKNIGSKEIILVTGHRRESFGATFEGICHAISEVADKYPDICWVYPVHLNPNVQEPVYRILGSQANIHLLEPLSYAPFVWLMNRSRFILTDSGGVQEEAPSLGKPVLVMRNTTERPEGVDAGVVTLVGNERENIVQHCCRLLETDTKELAEASPYGDGHASEKILDAIVSSSISEEK